MKCLAEWKLEPVVHADVHEHEHESRARSCTDIEQNSDGCGNIDVLKPACREPYLFGCVRETSCRTWLMHEMLAEACLAAKSEGRRNNNEVRQWFYARV